jgi:hypothetical protein
MGSGSSCVVVCATRIGKARLEKIEFLSGWGEISSATNPHSLTVIVNLAVSFMPAIWQNKSEKSNAF